MPYLMAFAAGAMLFVVFSELNADEKNDGPKLAVGAIAGMAVAATPKAQKLIGEAKRKVAEKAGQMKSDGCGCGCGMNE